MKSTQKIAMRRIGEMNNKGQLAGLPIAIISLVVTIIVFVLGLVIVQELRDTQAVGTEAYTAANSSLTGLGDFADFVPIIVIAIAAGVVVAIVLGSFAFRQRAR